MALRSLFRRPRPGLELDSLSPVDPPTGVRSLGGVPQLFIDGEWVPAIPVDEHEIRWRWKDGTGVATYYRDGVPQEEWTGRDAGRKAQQHVMDIIQSECAHEFEMGTPCCVFCTKPYRFTKEDGEPFAVRKT